MRLIKQHVRQSIHRISNVVNSHSRELVSNFRRPPRAKARGVKYRFNVHETCKPVRSDVIDDPVR